MATKDHLPERSSHSEAGIREGISRFIIPPSRVRPVFSSLTSENSRGSADKPEARDSTQELMEIGRKAMDCIHCRLLLKGSSYGLDIIFRGVGIRIGLTRYVSSLLTPHYSLLYFQPLSLILARQIANVQPEWAFANILDQIYEHQSFIKEYLQPLTTKAGYDINVKVSRHPAFIFLICKGIEGKGS